MAEQNRPDDNLEFQGNTTGASDGSGSGAPYSRNAGLLPPGENPPTRGPGPSAETQDGEDGDYVSQDQLFSDEWLIQKSHEMYTYSTDYLDANITNFWERNLAHFHNEHAPGTLYRRKDFKRSRTFRPKTRSNVKTQESSLANAVFSTLNLVEVEPQDARNPKQTLSAAINKALMQYRLEQTIPWFLTTIGAFQDTKVYGLCISHQYWNFKEDTDVIPAIGDDGKFIFEPDPETGEDIPMGTEERIVRFDEPVVDLLEPENFRFDPMCDWRDPAGTSPYIIRMVPMYAQEALEMMEIAPGKTGEAPWRKYSLGELLGTRRQDYDRTRQAREGRERIDPADEQHGNEFTTLWAHMNILRVDGEDWLYWTMGTELVLTSPIKLRDAYPWLRAGERPFVVGYSTIETHRNYPAGDVEQSGVLQEEINAVANQRLDNVKLVLNKRFYVRRGSQVDLDALIRNVPGGGVMMNDPEKDVVTVNTPDVTGSSYQEQAALSTEFDELVGGFNPASAGQKSVGGMTMAGAAANSVQDYGIKIFVETWIEPVLRQLTRLIQMYETDEVLIALAAENAQAFERFGVSQVNDDLMMQNLTVRVDVGMGNTDPMRRVERLVFAVSKTGELPGMAPRIKGYAIANEVFGALGYRAVDKFVMSDEEWAAHMEENPPGPGEIEVRMRELDIREQDNQMRDDRERQKASSETEQRVEDRLSKQDMKLNEITAQLSKADKSDQTARDIAAGKMREKTRETNIKQTTGSGI